MLVLRSMRPRKYLSFCGTGTSAGSRVRFCKYVSMTGVRVCSMVIRPFSRSTKRSTTWSMVVGCGPACGGAGCALAAGCVAAGCAVADVAVGADICAGCDVGCGSAGCCATALTDNNRVMTIQFEVRITLISMFLNTPTEI